MLSERKTAFLHSKGKCLNGVVRGIGRHRIVIEP